MSSLRVHEVALQVVAELAPLMPRIARQDRNLAQQLRRAATSIVLNIAEGEHSDPGTKRARFHTAAGSASETRAAIRLATAWRYLPPESVDSCLAGLDRVLAMLWRLTH
jgi:four helix bundle protein